MTVITKNLNWEIITKNLVAFKRWDGVKEEKFYYYGVSPINPTCTGGFHEKPIYRGEGLDSVAWRKRGSGVF